MTYIQSKQELIEKIMIEHQDLVEVITIVDEQIQIEHKIIGNWTIKDILGNLSEWHLIFLNWYNKGLRGESPEVPAKGFKWNDTAELHSEIYEKYKNRSLSEVKRQFDDSHDKVLEVAQKLSEKELFDPNIFSWTEAEPMATYIASSSSDHYRWAREQIVNKLK